MYGEELLDFIDEEVDAQKTGSSSAAGTSSQGKNAEGVIQDLRRKLDAYKAEPAKWTEEEALKRQQESAFKMMDFFNLRVVELESRLETMRDELDTERVVARERKDLIEKMRAKMSEIDSETSVSPSTTDGRVTELRTALRQLMANKDDLERARRDSERRLEELKSRNDNYLKIVAAAEEQRDKASQELQLKLHDMEELTRHKQAMDSSIGALRSDLEHAVKERDSLLDRVMTFEEERQEAEQKDAKFNELLEAHNEKLHHIEQLNSEGARLRHELAQKESEYAKIRDQGEEQKASLLETLDHLRQDISKRDQDYLLLADERDRLRDRKLELEEERRLAVEKLEHQVAAVESGRAMEARSAEEVRVQLGAKEVELSEALENLQKSTDELKETRQRRETVEAKLAEVEMALQSMEEQLASTLSKLSDRSRTLQEHEVALAQAKGDVDTFRVKLEAAELQISDLQASIDAAEKAQASLKEGSATFERRGLDLEEQLQKVTSGAKEENARLLDRLADREERLDKFQLQINDLDRQLKESKSKFEEEARAGAAARVELTEAVGKLVSCEQQLQDREDELNQKSAALDEGQKALKDMQAIVEREERRVAELEALVHSTQEEQRRDALSGDLKVSELHNKLVAAKEQLAQFQAELVSQSDQSAREVADLQAQNREAEERWSKQRVSQQQEQERQALQVKSLGADLAKASAELRTAQEALVQHVVEEEKQKAAADAEVESVQTELAKTQQLKQDAESTIGELMERLAGLQEKIDLASVADEKNILTITSLEGQNERLQVQLAAKETEWREKAAKTADLEQQHADKAQHVQDLEVRLQELGSALDDTRSKFAEAERRLQDSSTSQNKLRTELKTMQQEREMMSVLKGEKAHLESQLEQTQSEMALAEGELASVQTRLSEAEQNIAKLHDMRQELQLQLRVKEDELDDERRRNDDYVGELEASLTVFEGRMVDAQAGQLKAHNRLAELEATVAQMRRREEEAEEQVNGERASTERMGGELCALREELARVERELEESRLARTEQSDDLATVMDDRATAKAEVARLELEVADREVELERLAEQSARTLQRCRARQQAVEDRLADHLDSLPAMVFAGSELSEGKNAVNGRSGGDPAQREEGSDLDDRSPIQQLDFHVKVQNDLSEVMAAQAADTVRLMELVKTSKEQKALVEQDRDRMQAELEKVRKGLAQVEAELDASYTENSELASKARSCLQDAKIAEQKLGVLRKTMSARVEELELDVEQRLLQIEALERHIEELSSTEEGLKAELATAQELTRSLRGEMECATDMVTALHQKATKHANDVHALERELHRRRRREPAIIAVPALVTLVLSRWFFQRGSG